MKNRIFCAIGFVSCLLALSTYCKYLDCFGTTDVSKLSETRQAHATIKPVDDKNTFRRRLPQIIGIGSKKCGTAAFKTFLKFHSRVHITQIDETHFFDQAYGKGIQHYKNFMPLTRDTDLTFEKTPKYIVTKEVPQRIKQTYRSENVSTPKFVLVVCDPVQRAYSDFFQAEIHNVSQPHNFDEYLEYAFNKIEAITPLTDDVQLFYRHMDELYEDRQLRNVIRGVYSYFLQHWLHYFPREDFVIVQGGKLLTNPGEVMLKAQKDLGLKAEITPRHFVFNRAKGFFCVRPPGGKKECLGEVKGRTRKVKNGIVVQPQLSVHARKILEDFYRPFNEHFNRLTQMHVF